MKRTFSLLLCVIVLLVVVGAVAAQSEPVHQHYQMEGGNTFVCTADYDGAPVVTNLNAHYVITLNIHMLGGTRVRIHSNALATITNPVTGQVLRDFGANNDAYDYSAYPFVTRVWNGTLRHIVLPGEGSLYLDAGRFELVMDESDPANPAPVSVSFSGHFDALTQSFDPCVALGAGVQTGMIPGDPPVVTRVWQ